MKQFNNIVVANWKMQLSVAEAKELAKSIKELINQNHIDSKIEIVVCPDFVDLTEVAKIFKDTRIALGAQDGHYEDVGQFTGEISIKELKDLGCEYVILGHSERRALGETDGMVNKKVKTALKHNLTPILCVGETFEERKEGNKGIVIMHEVYEGLKDVTLKKGQRIIIAYEPVWVIGSGQAINAAEATDTASLIRQSYVDALNGQHLSALSIIYGGSVDPSNIRQFTSLNNIKGALVGGASLKSNTFVEIIKNI